MANTMQMATIPKSGWKLIASVSNILDRQDEITKIKLTIYIINMESFIFVVFVEVWLRRWAYFGSFSFGYRWQVSWSHKTKTEIQCSRKKNAHTKTGPDVHEGRKRFLAHFTRIDGEISTRSIGFGYEPRKLNQYQFPRECSKQIFIFVLGKEHFFCICRFK